MIITKAIDEIKPSAYKNFSCGNPELDEYLKRFSKANHKKGIGKTFVFVQDDKVIGFYTISMASIEFQYIPEEHRGGIPKYPLPVARICRLAVDSILQGKNIGAMLLVDALNKIYVASQTVAAYAVVVDAKNEDAKRFYTRLGFIPYQGHPLSLYLPIAFMEKLFHLPH